MTHEEKMKLLIDENKMGCQCLWLVESISKVMNLKPRALNHKGSMPHFIVYGIPEVNFQ
jgi:hypothetical protein